MNENVDGNQVRSERRSGRGDRRKIPAYAFWKGAAAGLLVVIPAAALTVWGAARVGLLDQHAGLISCLRMALVFAGLAAVLTAGGVGRLAAQASAERNGGKARAMLAAARAMAPAGAALTIIAAIPHGGLPMTPAGWIGLAVAGAMAGAASGVVIGMACSGEMPTLQELGVWPPTEWPLPLPWPRGEHDDDDEPPKAVKAVIVEARPPERASSEPAPEPPKPEPPTPEPTPDVAEAKPDEPEEPAP